MEKTLRKDPHIISRALLRALVVNFATRPLQTYKKNVVAKTAKDVLNQH